MQTTQKERDQKKIKVKIKNKKKEIKKFSKKTTKNKITLYFYEDTHEYIDSRNKKYISVTTLIKKYFPFDEYQVAKEISERNGDPIDLILNHWKYIRDTACEHGNNVHFSCETFIKENKILEFQKDKTNNCVLTAIDFLLSDINKYGKIISCEKLLFDSENLIAGQCDLVLRKGNTLIIGDWKTNEKLSRESFDNQTGLYPLNKIPNCDFYKYFIQLNIYLYLIIKNNLYPWAEDYKLIIFHIKERKVIPHYLNIDLKLIEEVIKNYSKYNTNYHSK